MTRRPPFNRQQRFVVEQIYIPPGPRITANLFPVRVLVGWFTEPQDIAYLAGSHRQVLSTKVTKRLRDLIRSGNAARAQLAALEQGRVVEDLRSEYKQHAQNWREQIIAQPYIAEGWEIRTVHLTNVVSLQPVVEIRKCNAMMSSLHPNDVDGLASFALPMGQDSFVQIARLDGRYVLRNGYHRAYSLLRSGIDEIPALVRDVHVVAELTLPGGVFAPHVYASHRPPILSDFLHPRLAATVT